MSKLRVPLYDRLPEIYRIWDVDQTGPTPLKSFLALVETAFGHVHENIEGFYEDHFIDFCDDWVIPYLADLVGTTHLAGNPWTLRADVADTIALRRRKGTLAAIERLTYDLSGWGVHAVELRQNLVWAQHLNHQRPDDGGAPPYRQPPADRFTPVRGGTITLRDPAMLSAVGTPFDPFAHFPDLRSPSPGEVRYNLPTLAIFLWRLEAYTLIEVDPVPRGSFAGVGAGAAAFVVRFDVDPLGRTVRLFNRSGFDPDNSPPVVTELDSVPGPIAPARLTSASPAGNPVAYVRVEGDTPPAAVDPVGIRLHVPEAFFSPFDATAWRFRGANLCAWEEALAPPLRDLEVAIDPIIGRIVIGIPSAIQAVALLASLRISYTYGAVGKIGAHPTDRANEWPAALPDPIEINRGTTVTVVDALADLQVATETVVIEIADNRVHSIDLSIVAGIEVPGGDPAQATLLLSRSLIIRAADGFRPILKLAQPLRFRAADLTNASGITVRFEGVFVTPGDGFPAGQPLIARAAVDRLEIYDATLDPGGHKVLDNTRDGTRAAFVAAIRLSVEPAPFVETPEVVLQRSVAGAVLADSGYRLSLTNCTIDAGGGVSVDPLTAAIAIGTSVGDPLTGWGAPLAFESITVFGRTRVDQASGSGGIFVHALEVLDHQHGCIKYSRFAGIHDRLPQNFASVTGALLRFTSEVHGAPGYAQLDLASDERIRERGADDDAMGAFGPPAGPSEPFKWRNLKIRYREFMPADVRPILVPIT